MALAIVMIIFWGFVVMYETDPWHNDPNYKHEDWHVNSD